MKRITALILSLMLLLCAVSAVADEAGEKTRLGNLKVGQEFIIQTKIPEDYRFSTLVATDLNLVGILSSINEDKASVTVSIAYNEEYAGIERFNDVDEAIVDEIKASFQDMDDVVFEDLETSHGTRLLKVTQTNRSFADIYTVYKGYELEFVLTAQGEVTDADIQMLVDFISDMDFVAVE